MEQLFKKIDSHQDEFIQLLKEAVAIKSVSADAAYRDEVFRMITWTAEKLKGIGATVELIDNGMQSLPDGKQIKLPPVLFGTLGRDKSKKTLCVYGHLDVQPATKSDGWNTEPFELTVKDGKMFGRGSSDDKGPVLAWVNAIQTMQELKIDIPVNIKFVFEGMEESGSEGLVDILTKHKDSFLGDVDATCISDNYWLGRNKPCLTYGLRGVCYYFVEVSNPKQDLHSGIYGGALHEPMTSLIKLLGTLTKTDGTINIDGLYDLVAPMKEGEDALYENIDFDPEDFRKNIDANFLTTSNKAELLKRSWRMPSLSIHGIQGAFHEPGSKTVIPCKVTGKFSIRIVPDMTPDDVHQLVCKHIEREWQKLESDCDIRFQPMQGNMPWVADFNNPLYKAGARAQEKVFGVSPDYTREGCSIPITLTFQELTEKNVMLLPIGACDDMAHSQNEKMNISNYMNGIKTLAAFLLELKGAL
ncbi:unnamed protein product [Bursaphelenchus xylophilus]|uniref:(pine wood nematode) hypothetical protein n=1 Tax=Bursaphelenchus xylophilus TaxID=6326 RepID=A0A7I8WMB9_BURXY|nr:unnamed protein product [Bursaphelenchus xylophilus]CAG9104650.1 unnamed protein product [Bursaphelenchus xylophilus]